VAGAASAAAVAAVAAATRERLPGGPATQTRAGPLGNRFLSYEEEHTAASGQAPGGVLS
jgi:hypothetical protein